MITTPYRKTREFLRCNIIRRFPSLIRALPAVPIFADLKITRRCTGKCTICNFWQPQEGHELSTDEWKTVIGGLQRAGVLEVSFTGGDILLRPDAFELMRFAVTAGLKVHCIINGLAMTSTIARELIATGLSSILVSLDDLGSTMNHIRGVPDAASSAIRSIETLKKEAPDELIIALAMTIMKATLASVKKVTRFALERNLSIIYNLIHFTHYFTDTPQSRLQYRLDQAEHGALIDLMKWAHFLRKRYPALLPKDTHLEWIPSYFADHRQKRTPCYKPLLKLCLEADGQVRACCSQPAFGKITHQDLNDLIRSRAYGAIVTKALRKDCPGCSCHYPLSLDVDLFSRIRGVALRTGFVKFLDNCCLHQ